MGAERDRLTGPDVEAWRRWGPFVSEREWGTVREDYSADGEAWGYLTHDEARSTAYRWGEDGLAGVCDRRQGMGLSLAFWNGRDPVLKERLFGLTGKEGNHGEDVKEAWWYVDATPTHSWLRWRYLYPQLAFPYEDLVAENARRGPDRPEYELADTGALDASWDVEATWAKAGPDDLCLRVRATNRGPDHERLHVLPHLWFRNVWSWGAGKARPVAWAVPDEAAVVAEHAGLGRWVAAASGGAGIEGAPRLLCVENETNTARRYGAPGGCPYPKDGIGDHVVGGAASVNPELEGTRVAWWFVGAVEPGETVEVRLRVRRVGPTTGERPRTVGVRPDLGAGFDDALRLRRREADAFYDELTPPDVPDDERSVLRQAFAGLLWSQQFYRFDVAGWLDGDPGTPTPPPGRGAIRNGHWRHLDANDVICMPDKWEYPWFASWDLAFHCVALAHVDPALAKAQLLLLCREWYQHPDGALPAYEWEFSDANPPVHAWAAMRVFETAARVEGRPDRRFLERIFHKLLLNFTWWVNRKDAQGNNAFEGGFLGLDNIGPFNRSQPLPVAGLLEQSDATGWMAMYCLNLLEIALTLALENDAYEDVAVKFFEHFAYIAEAMDEVGFWSEEDGFFYDVVQLADGTVVPLPVRSMVGLVPLAALTVLPLRDGSSLPEFAARARWFLEHRPTYGGVIGRATESATGDAVLLSAVSLDRLRRVLRSVLDESEFLSAHGLRSLSRHHLAQPVTVDLGGARAEVGYEPAESRSGLFGGNSNWRGPVWFPLNVLLIEALRRIHEFAGDATTVELPTGSGRAATFDEVADDLSARLVSLFLPGPDGRRPVDGERPPPVVDDDGHPLTWFYEYFDGDTGAGLGASHQTGWTALVADLVLARRRAR